VSKYDNLIFVDCEAVGLGCPSLGLLTEIGAVHFASRATFHGVLAPHKKFEHLVGKHIGAESALRDAHGREVTAQFKAFDEWLAQLKPPCRRWTLVSDNPAFDWQWINDGFLRALGASPFGFSARRIGDFYAGLAGDWTKATEWKSLRVTTHDHNPVNDAMGNAEAFARMLAGERA